MKRKGLIPSSIACLLGAVVLAASLSGQTPGTVDPTYSVKVQRGGFATYNGAVRPGLCRLNTIC